jgi:hypothetical protein
MRVRRSVCSSGSAVVAKRSVSAVNACLAQWTQLAATSEVCYYDTAPTVTGILGW